MIVTAARAVLFSGGGVCAVAISAYGVVGYLVYPFVKESERAELVASFASTGYGGLLGWHLVAGAGVATGCWFGMGRLGRRSVRRTGPPWLGMANVLQGARPGFALALLCLPLLALCVSLGNGLFARQEYLDFTVSAPWLFLAGSGTAALGVAGSFILLRKLPGRRGHLILCAWALLVGYLIVFMSLETREVAIAAGAVAIGRKNTETRLRKLGVAALVALAVVGSVSMALEARGATGEHGLWNYGSTASNAFGQPADGVIANVLNGFHASGVALSADYALTNSEVSAAFHPIPFVAGRAESGRSLEFSSGFPVPTLGSLAAGGLWRFIGIFVSIGVVFGICERQVCGLSRMAALPASLRTPLRVLPSVLGALTAAFVVQYKVTSVGTPLLLLFWLAVACWVVRGASAERSRRGRRPGYSTSSRVGTV